MRLKILIVMVTAGVLFGTVTFFPGIRKGDWRIRHEALAFPLRA